MKLCVWILFLAVCTVVSGKRAIATLLSGMPSNAERYTRLLHFFVYSLRNAGYDGEIVVMYASDFPIDPVKLSQKLNVKMKLVEKIMVEDNTGRGNPHYASMLTKLHLWNLLEYEQIMYYDCDFIFQGNPAPAFADCSWSKLCATPDTGIHNVNKSIKKGTYFNGGFLVLRPNKDTYKYLLSNAHLAKDKFFVEQDLLNQLYKDSWGKLDQKYNLMHCYQLGEISTQVVAVHEKMWVLRGSFPGSKYIWNSSKMKVQYPLSEVMTVKVRDDAPASSSDGNDGSTKSKQIFETPFRFKRPSKADNMIENSKVASFNASTLSIPTSIQHNATATAAYKEYVMNQIQLKRVKSPPDPTKYNNPSPHSAIVEASITRAPKKNKFTRKSINGSKRPPSRSRSKVTLHTRDESV